jgi:hypothetical protein
MTKKHHQEQDPLNFPRLNLYIAPESPQARAMVDEVVSIIFSVDRFHIQRQGLSERRLSSLAKLRNIASAIVTHLLHECVVNRAAAGIRIPLSKRNDKASRYKPEWFTYHMLSIVMEMLQHPEAGFCTLIRGSYDIVNKTGKQTRLITSERIFNRSKSLTLADFGTDASQESVVLKVKSNEDGKRPKGDHQEYNDTAFTVRRREQMRLINESLQRASIEFKGVPVRSGDRLLKSYFNDSFYRGGRLFGGLWQNMSKNERHQITINGKNLVEIDLKTCNLRLAYAYLGESMESHISGDAYDLGVRGSFVKRNGSKKVMNAMIYSDKRLTKFPEGARAECNAPRSIKFEHVEQLIYDRHPLLKPIFYGGVGMNLMFLESEILVSALLKLISQGIVALPIHDCVLVESHYQKAAEEALMDAFLEVSGQAGAVSSTPLMSNLMAA